MAGPTDDSLVLRPVAYLRTPFAEKFGVPRQSGLVPAAEGRVEFVPEFDRDEFVRGLEAFTHLWLITHFHQNPPWTGSATVRPPRLGGNERVGLFASRTPNRPNPLGLSLVRLLGIEPAPGLALKVAGVDAVDGTPVFDVKPYLPWCEAPADAAAGWAGAPPAVRDLSRVRLSPELAAHLGAQTLPSGESVLSLVRQVLTLDHQPAYQDEEARVYGMTLAGWNIRWRPLADGGVEVISADLVRPVRPRGA